MARRPAPEGRDYAKEAALYKRLCARLEVIVDGIIYDMRDAGLEPDPMRLREGVTDHLFYAFCDELHGSDSRLFGDLINCPATADAAPVSGQGDKQP